MGRNPWGTPEQVAFLYSKAPGLAEAKTTIGLNVYYAGIFRDFLKTWGAEPVVSDDSTISPEVLKQKAVDRLEKVRTLF